MDVSKLTPRLTGSGAYVSEMMWINNDALHFTLLPAMIASLTQWNITHWVYCSPTIRFSSSAASNARFTPTIIADQYGTITAAPNVRFVFLSGTALSPVHANSIEVFDLSQGLWTYAPVGIPVAANSYPFRRYNESQNTALSNSSLVIHMLAATSDDGWDGY